MEPARKEKQDASYLRKPIVRVVELVKEPMRNPHYFARALLDYEAEKGRPLAPHDVKSKAVGQWIRFHGGTSKARELAKQARASLGENERLALAWRAGDQHAVKPLLDANEGYIRRVARSYAPSLELDDLMQLGKMGFLDAAMRFRAVKNTKLRTYAPWRIGVAVKRGVGGLLDAEGIKFPKDAFDARSKISREQRRSYTREGRWLSQEEQQRAVGKHLASRATGVSKVFSLEERLRAGGKLTFGDVLASAAEGPALGETIDLRSALEKLAAQHPNWAQVIKRRYGIGVRKETLEKVAKRLKVTNQRVHQLEGKALERLRKLLVAKKE